MSAKGHSNVRLEEFTTPPHCPEKALIGLVGGATLQTCRPLPPLALTRQEWEEIGRKMGWLDAGPRTCEHALCIRDAQAGSKFCPLHHDAEED